MLCHDARFLYQNYTVLETKISCLQHLVKGSNTKKNDIYTFTTLSFTAYRMFSLRYIVDYIWGHSGDLGTRFP